MLILTEVPKATEKGSGGKFMNAVSIKLSLAENVKYFVSIVNKYPYEIDLRVGRHVVNGRSLLGIFSLDLSKPIALEVYADSCEDLMDALRPFIID